MEAAEAQAAEIDQEASAKAEQVRRDAQAEADRVLAEANADAERATRDARQEAERSRRKLARARASTSSGPRPRSPGSSRRPRDCGSACTRSAGDRRLPNWRDLTRTRHRARADGARAEDRPVANGGSQPSPEPVPEPMPEPVPEPSPPEPDPDDPQPAAGEEKNENDGAELEEEGEGEETVAAVEATEEFPRHQCKNEGEEGATMRRTRRQSTRMRPAPASSP